MKTSRTTFQFKKTDIIELNRSTLVSIAGGTLTPGGECFLCIRTSNGPGSIILEQLKQA